MIKTLTVYFYLGSKEGYDLTIFWSGHTKQIEFYFKAGM